MARAGTEVGTGLESIHPCEPGDTALKAATRYYVVVLLTLVGTANFLDRQVLSILLEPIRGITSDLLRSTFGENSLRIALLGACGIGLPAAIFFYRASLTYRSDVAAAERRISTESGA